MTLDSTSTALGPWDRVAIVTLGAAGSALSYDAIQQMAVAIHVRGLLTYLFPAVIDGFIAYGVRALILTRHAPLRARLYVWTLFGTATAASIWANALHAIRLNQLDRGSATGLRLDDSTVGLLSTLAPLALAGAVHLYILIARHPGPDQGIASPLWSVERGPEPGPVRAPRTDLPDRSAADRALTTARTGPDDGPGESSERGPVAEPANSSGIGTADRSATADHSEHGPQTEVRHGPQQRTEAPVPERLPWTDGMPQPATTPESRRSDGPLRTEAPALRADGADETASEPYDRRLLPEDGGPVGEEQRTGPHRSVDREDRRPLVRPAIADQGTGTRQPDREEGEPADRESQDEDPRTGPHTSADRSAVEANHGSADAERADQVPETDEEFEALLAAVRDIVKNELVLKRTLLRAALEKHNNAAQDAADKVQVSNERLGPILQRLKQERQIAKTAA